MIFSLGGLQKSVFKISWWSRDGGDAEEMLIVGGEDELDKDGILRKHGFSQISSDSNVWIILFHGLSLTIVWWIDYDYDRDPDYVEHRFKWISYDTVLEQVDNSHTKTKLNTFLIIQLFWSLKMLKFKNFKFFIAIKKLKIWHW